MTAEARPEPVAKPPPAPKPKWGAIGCLFFGLLAFYFVTVVTANLVAIALAHRWWGHS